MLHSRAKLFNLYFYQFLLLFFWLWTLPSHSKNYELDIKMQSCFNKIFSIQDYKFNKSANYQAFFRYSGLTPLNNFPPIDEQSYEKEFDQVWQLVQNDFLYQDRLKDWPKWKKKYHNKLSNIASEKSAIKEMLKSLNDEYTSLRDDQGCSNNQTDNLHKIYFHKLNGQVGYLKINDFSDPTITKQFIKAFKNLKSATGYIIDLRNNPGGSVDTAFKVFNILAKQGEFVEMVGFLNGIKQKEILAAQPYKGISIEGNNLAYLKRLPCLNSNKPIVILINRDTMSAAEMLAGACKYNNLATLVGEPSFGKGVVQRVWNLNNQTVIRITSENYFLPNGASINGKGLRPDIVVFNNKNSDNQLKVALKLLLNK